MCGIAGWSSFTRDLRLERGVVEAMTETLLPRGPDAGGYWLEPHVALGHRRLAIVDLEGGIQPMVVPNPEGSIALTYSGEVYNFRELRAELSQRGHRFLTGSDTEVVLRGYHQWGLGLAERLNGMFAFAIWDGRSEELILVRDRLGVKPLYHAFVDGGLAFASEPKAILAHPAAKREVDLDGLREALGWTRTPGKAVWHGMREVKPGTQLVWNRGSLREHRYWRLQAERHTHDRDETVARVRDLLTDTVSRQMVADVKVCSLLSGGLDSSAVAALASAGLAPGDKLQTFSVDFKSHADRFAPDAFRDSADAPFAIEMAAHIGAEHRNLVLDADEIAHAEVRRAVIAARDLPTGFGDADNSLYLLFREIRRSATVALSGESADEVFGGYRWFHQPQALQGDTFPWVDHTHVTSFKTGLQAFAPDLVAKLALPDYARGCYDEALREVPLLDGEDASERRMREILHLHLTRYLRILLDRKDRLSMAVGLEVRVPFCDHRLVEYVFNTPWRMKTFDGREKSLLRAAVADRLPASILQRTKAPYPSTQDLAYVATLQRQALALVAESAHPARDLLDFAWIRRAATLAADQVDRDARHGLERALDFATWIDVARPEFALR
jgi:asparagine synthase (glutamine-hydrolysing)